MTKVYLPMWTSKSPFISKKSNQKSPEWNRFVRLHSAGANPDQFDDDGTLKITAGIVEGFYVAGESSHGLFGRPF